MLADRWQRLRAAYDAMMDAPESERPRILAELSGSDPELGRELKALVNAAATPDTFLDTPIARLIPARLQSGTLLCDRFLLLRMIGHGGMGEVWAAHDQALKEDIAIKTIRVAGDDPQSLKRFRREIQLARRIAHPNVCRVYELFEDTSVAPPRSFLTMELIEGETLAARLARLGAMDPVEALAVFRQTVAGVGAAHEADVTHRDLKPANIMLVSGSSGRRAVVMDFGLARDHTPGKSDGATLPGTLVGTPEYMAPEQVSGAPATAATDIYALGLILFEMLRGTRPFAGSSTLDSWMRRAREGPERLSGAVPGVEARIDSVIARCLEYEPSRRYQTANEVLRALDASFHLAVPRSRRFWIPAAVIALAILGTAAAMTWARLRPELPPAEALRWYDDAQEALSESASVRALNAIHRAIELAPTFAPSHAALAEIRLELDMPSAAQEAMLRANELARDRTRLPAEYVLYMDGIQALLQHQCDAAIDALRQLADTVDSPKRSSRMVTAARAMERCDRPDDAQALMADAAQVDPLNAAIPLRRARLAAGRREFKLAMTSLDTAEKLFRDRNNVEGIAEAFTARGALEVQQDLLQQADITLMRAGEVADSLDDVRQQIRIRLQQAIVHRKRGDLGAAEQLTSQAVELGRARNLETLALEGLFASGNVHLVRNQFSKAQELFERALRIAETHRHEEFQARARLALATAFVPSGQTARAVAAIAYARSYYERVHQLRNLAIASTLAGQIRLTLAEYDEATREFESAVAAARQQKDSEQEVRALENLGTALTGTGRYGDALMHYQRAADMHSASRQERRELFARLNIADLFSRMGRFKEAGETLADVRRSPPLSSEMQSRVLRVEAANLLRQGQFAAARAIGLKAFDVGDELPPERRWRVWITICQASGRLGLRAEAWRACQRVLDEASEASHSAVWLDAMLAQAEIALLFGNFDAARNGLGKVASHFGPERHREDRWKFLALSCAVVPAVDRTDLRGQLTRELEKLRLTWREGFGSWSTRHDVSAMLAQCGATTSTSMRP
jgi:tetratricopeptide (TPR) repeat protein